MTAQPTALSAQLAYLNALVANTKTYVRHNHVNDACIAYNEARGIKYPAMGALYYADVKGDGIYRPCVYVVSSSSGGLTCLMGASSTLRTKLGRVLALIDDLPERKP